MAVEIAGGVRELVNKKDIVDPKSDTIVAVNFEGVVLAELWQDEAFPFNADVVRGHIRDEVFITPVDVDDAIVLGQVGSPTEPPVGIVMPFQATLHEQEG